jgi:hypothetical protein
MISDHPPVNGRSGHTDSVDNDGEMAHAGLTVMVLDGNELFTRVTENPDVISHGPEYAGHVGGAGNQAPDGPSRH